MVGNNIVKNNNVMNDLLVYSEHAFLNLEHVLVETQHLAVEEHLKQVAYMGTEMILMVQELIHNLKHDTEGTLFTPISLEKLLQKKQEILSTY